MALTPSRWIAMALLGCMALAVALLPPNGRPLPLVDWFLPGPAVDGDDPHFGRWAARDPERTRLALVSRVLNRAEHQVEALALRDSAAVLLSRLAPATTAVTVLLDGPVPALAAARARQLASLIEQQLTVTGRSTIRTVIVVKPGSTERSTSWTLFPGVLSENRCVTVFTLDSSGRSAELSASEAVAACTYFSAFGRPGHGMAGLLAARDFDLIRDARFGGETAFAPPGRPALDDRPTLFGSTDGDGLAWPFWVSVLARSCQVGQAESCQRAILQEARVTPWDSIGLRERVWDGRFRFWRADRLGEISGTLLPDLVREFGPDTVRKLWQAEQPLPEAFAAATGRRFGDWLAGYVPHKLGRSLSGPVLRWQSALLTLLLASLAVAASAMAASRREVR